MYKEVVEFPNEILSLNNDNNSQSNYIINNNCNEFPINTNLKYKLQSWVLHYKVPHNSVNCILNIMRSEGLNLPKDVR